MKKLESSLKNMVIVLTGVTVIAGALLGYVNELTKEPIKKADQEALNKALKEVLPEFKEVKADTLLKEDGKTIDYIVYPATNEANEWVGTAVRASINGFGGEMKVLVGFDKEGNIINYSLLSHAETPGLGSKAADWFKKGQKGDITGMNPGKGALVVNKDGGDVDAITASTITSRAFLSAVNAAYAAYSGQNVDTTSGATQQATATETEVKMCENDSTKVCTGQCGHHHE